MSQSNQRVFNGRFVVKKRIASGSFGIVFLAHDKVTKEDCALKLEKEENEEVRSLDKEVQILLQLTDVVGVPRLIWHGSEQDFRLIVIQLLGHDLAYYFKTQKKFSLKCSVQIAYEAVQVLRNIHNKYVVHRDLKPENILMSKDNDAICLVDFGISKIYYETEHMPFRDDKTFMGTTRYASVAAHKGHELSRKDDLESLFYVIMYFLRGSLPWQNMQVADQDRTRAVGDMKASIDLNELCQGFPNEFVQIFQFIKLMRFKEEPDYNHILGLLSQIADSQNFAIDGIYDWSEPIRITKKQSSLDSNVSLAFNKIQKETSPRNNGMRSSQKISNQMLWSVNDQGVMGQSQRNLLVPPDPHTKPGGRSEQRHFSQSSSLSNMGSLSSMRIKYMPSIIEEDKPFLKDKNIKNSDVASHYNEQINENLNDTPLCIKYNKLKVNESRSGFICVQKFKTSR